MIKFTPQGTCSKEITIELDGDKIKDIKFLYGCPGNTKGVAALAKGMKISEVIEKLEGIECGQRGTSCPDQIAKALKTI